MNSQFTPRERQVIAYLLQGKSDLFVALALGLSVRAVEFHLGNIYTRLGVTSRTEAALILQQRALRQSTGTELWQSTTSEAGQTGENGENSLPNRRLPMKKRLPALGAILLITILIAASLLAKIPTRQPESSLSPTLAAQQTASPWPATLTPQPTISTRPHLLDQMRQMADEYEQAVQAEKKNGHVEFGKDPQSGNDVFFFKGASYDHISKLYMELNIQIIQLGSLYAQVYRDEIKPTPFPTFPSPEENRAFYEFLVTEQGKEYCVYDANVKNAITLPVYRPEDGIYTPIIVGDVDARCRIWGDMVEEFRLAPWLERVNQERDIALIRQVMGNPALKLNFKTIDPLANALSYQAAIYVDETGTRYGVEISTGAFALLEPNYPTHPIIAESDRKSLDELRGAARQFALTLSPRLREIERDLLFEESCKGELCFFRWDVRNRDWSGTDWVFMPPLLQVGMLANGQVATLVNTLELWNP